MKKLVALFSHLIMTNKIITQRQFWPAQPRGPFNQSIKHYYSVLETHEFNL